MTHANPATPRHTAVVRITHWLTFIAFLLLLLTGIEILISHPRFYWGETGNVNTTPLFSLHIPSSRDTVLTGYKTVLPDQNGWSRYLHFQSAWLMVITALIYGIASLWSGHFGKDLVPPRGQRTWKAFTSVLTKYLRRPKAEMAEAATYNVVQQTAYIAVIFILFPQVIWTGLAMSPSFDSAVAIAVNMLGGRQSARTLHFFVSDALVLFLIVHVVMVAMGGFRTRVRAMITGRFVPRKERT
jgi:thiosulfate reductase cytochrome b subunit